MKARALLLLSAGFVLITFSVVSPSHGANVITFDDLSERAEGNFITNGYQGVTWVNFGAGNALLFAATYGSNGVYYGMVSPSNVAVNVLGNPADIASSGESFNFLSAYLTGIWNSNLNIEVQGFSGVNMLYDTNVLASATSPTLFDFNYLNIDRLHFSNSGGQPAFGKDIPGFVMDNLSIEYVPEPSTVLLAALGALTLCAFLKRKPS